VPEDKGCYTPFTTTVRMSKSGIGNVLLVKLLAENWFVMSAGQVAGFLLLLRRGARRPHFVIAGPP